MRGGDARRDDQAVIVRMHHDQGAYEAGAHAPAGGPGVLELSATALEFDASGLGKILTEEMRGSGLNGFAVLNHRLDAISAKRAGEAFALAFLAGENRQRQKVPRECLINAQHFHRLLFRLFAGLVGGVALLPEEFGGAEKQAWTHFPADDIRPLVQQNRQVAPGFHPACVGRADDGLGGGTHHKRLGKLPGGHEFSILRLEAVMGDDCAFLRETLDMRSLLLEVAQRNEEREVGVLVSRGLEHPVEHGLHPLPERVAGRLDDHATAHLGVLGEIRRADDLLIPLGKILVSPGRDGRLLFVAHERGIIAGAARR